MTNRPTSAADTSQSEKPGFAPQLKEAFLNLAQPVQEISADLFAGFRKKLAGVALLTALSPVVLAANAPDAPVAAQTAATAPAVLPEAEGKFAEVTAETPRTRFALGTDGASAEVAVASDLTNIVFFRHPGAKVLAQAQGKPLEFQVIAVVPEKGENPQQVFKYAEAWKPLGTDSGYYAFKEAPISIPLGDLTNHPGTDVYFGYSSGDTANERMDNVVKNGTYDRISLTPLPKLASLTIVNVAGPGMQVTSESINLSTIEGVGDLPATVSSVGADIIATPLNGQPGQPTKTAVINKGDTFQMVGTTPDELGANALMKVVVNGKEITWTVVSKEVSNTTPAPETVETPEIKEVNVESLSTNETTPTKFNTAVKFTIPKGATEVYVMREFYNGQYSSGGMPDSYEYTSGTPIQPDALGEKYKVFYMDKNEFKIFYFTLHNKADKQP